MRPLPRPANAKAAHHGDLLERGVGQGQRRSGQPGDGRLRAGRADLAADGGKGWTEDRNVDIIVKYTGAKREVIKKARAHVVDPNLETDPAVLESMQKLAGDMGYLKYKDLLPVGKIFNFTYRDRAVREAGRK